MDSLQDKLDYQFKDPSLLNQALTHPSNTSGQDDSPSYERLEFLGDAVLQLLAAETIYLKNPQAREGHLTRVRAAVVNGASLSEIARSMDLGRHVRMSADQIKNKGQDRARTLEDALEALFGALYLDGGLETAQSVFHKLFDPVRFLVEEDRHEKLNPKGALQETLQSKNPDCIPIYEIIREDGPDHRKEFKAVVKVDGAIIGEGRGHSKKVATSQAAREALKHWKDLCSDNG